MTITSVIAAVATEGGHSSRVNRTLALDSTLSFADDLWAADTLEEKRALILLDTALEDRFILLALDRRWRLPLLLCDEASGLEVDSIRAYSEPNIMMRRF